MSSHHANPFSHSHRSNGTRIPSNSSSGSSWHDPNRWANDPADMDQLFTSDMRDRQARGKDPYADDLSDAVRGMGMHHRAMSMTPGAAAGSPSSSRHPKEPFQKTERRDWAETVLDNPELLLMYAQSSGDTLPATRLRFKRIMCGLEDDDDEGADVANNTISDLSRAGQYQQHYQQPRFSSQQRSGRGGASGGSRNGR